MHTEPTLTASRPGCRGALVAVAASYRHIQELRYAEPDRLILVCAECGQLWLWHTPPLEPDAVLLGCDDPVLARPGSDAFPMDLAAIFLPAAAERLERAERAERGEEDPPIVADDDDDPFAGV